MKVHTGSPIVRFAFALCLALTASCLRLPILQQEQFDEGTLSNTTYSNKFFGMTLTLPKYWLAQGQAEMKALAKPGAEKAVGNDRKLQGQIDASVDRTHFLLTLFRRPQDDTTAPNAAITLTAEKIPFGTGVTTGRQYLAEASKYANQGPNQPQLKGAGTEDIGGVVFDKMEGSVSVGRLTLTERLYGTIRKGYGLAMFVVYVAGEDGTTIDETLKSIRFQ